MQTDAGYIGRVDLADRGPQQANEGIQADHNLTIYEACLIYGPTFPQILQSWNHIPHNFDWFFTIFTPLADFAVPYQDQLLIGLEWGDGERMLDDGLVPGGILPRALEPISELQKALLTCALEREAGQRLLFSHFTYVNFTTKTPFRDTQPPPAANARASEERSSGPLSCKPEDADSRLLAGTFEKNRVWLYEQLATDRIAATLSGHLHRSGAYQMNLGKFDELKPFLARMTAKAYAPDKHHTPPEAKILVSSCAGGMGTQNICGELDGWNLMPPSGTRFEGATGKIRTVAARDLIRAKPRFCVALDYLQCHEGKRVIEWKYQSGGRGEKPQLSMVIRNVRHAVPFVRGVTFYVWNSRKTIFNDFETIPQSRSRQIDHLEFDCPMDEIEKFATALGLLGGEQTMAFAKVEFNQELTRVTDSQTGARLYDQYNFDDPWIFRINSDRNGTIAYHEDAEIPTWNWLWQKDKSRYPNPRTITQAPRPLGR